MRRAEAYPKGLQLAADAGRQHGGARRIPMKAQGFKRNWNVAAVACHNFTMSDKRSNLARDRLGIGEYRARLGTRYQ